MGGTIVVIGVTGIQGSSVARKFLQQPGWKVRGITRDPFSAVATTLSSERVELFKGNLDDPSSLIPAMAGATAIFANTDYFVHLFQAVSNPSILQNRTPNQYAYEREVQQGLNIAQAANHPSTLTSLKFFIYSWLSETRKWSQGKYMKNLHNDAKAETVKHIRANYPAVAERLSLLEVGQYVTNWKISPTLQPQKQGDGEYVFRSPLPANLKVPFVWPQKDVGEFAWALTEMPVGTLLGGVSERLTWPEWAETWSKVLNVKATYTQVDANEWFAGTPAPEAFVEEFKEAYAYIAEFGYDGGDPDYLQVDQLPFKVSTTSVEEYIRGEDWTSVL